MLSTLKPKKKGALEGDDGESFDLGTMVLHDTDGMVVTDAPTGDQPAYMKVPLWHEVVIPTGYRSENNAIAYDKRGQMCWLLTVLSLEAVLLF